jgi:hypothetical protein
MSESKAVVGYFPTLAGGTEIMNFKGKQLTYLSVNPLGSNPYTTPYNLLERYVTASTSFPVIGGDPSTLIGSQAKIYGDTALGNEYMPTFLRVRGEFRNAIWAPPSKTRILCVMGNAGDAPTVSTLWKNQCNNAFLDDLNYPRYKLIGQYDFYLGGISKAGNKGADLHKPGGGTGSDNATGTYWMTDGVAAGNDAQEATATENLVLFNVSGTMETMAPRVHMMDWKISLAKVGKVTFNGGTYNASGFITNNISNGVKEKGLWLVAYNYANNIQGSNEQHANVLVDELHWKFYFKDL